MYYLLIVLILGGALYYEYDLNSQLQAKLDTLQGEADAAKQQAQQSVANEALTRKRLADVLARPQIILPPPTVQTATPAPDVPLSGIPAAVSDLVALYGNPDGLNSQTPAMGYSGQLLFNHAGMSLQANTRSGHVLDMTVNRSDAFNTLEIESILEQLSAGEEWKQVDSNDWLLPGKAKAHWDGEGHLTVQ
jgi:hypothetical protein